MLPSSGDFLRVAEEKGYLVFREKSPAPNLNIVGWRNKRAAVDRFDDYITAYWEEEGKWKSRIWPATTRPGKPWLLYPLSKKGTAILKPGQYLQAYSVGLFKGVLALRQARPVTVYRDDNKDPVWDTDKAETGMFGIHIHRAGLLSTLVGRNSAGCQVFSHSADFKKFLELCQRSAGFYGNQFSYTLLEF